jgi:hypothetical protein
MQTKENIAIELLTKLSKEVSAVKLDPLTILAIVRVIIEIITKIIEARQNRRLGVFGKTRLRLIVLFSLGRSWLKHANTIEDFVFTMTEEQKVLMLSSK